jgi:hypothetical protein
MAAPELKYTDRDVRSDPSLMELAVAYVLNYNGEFEPLVEAKDLFEEDGELTVPIARKVLNCMRHDATVAMNLPKPNYGQNVLQFPQPPPRSRRKVTHDKKQCDVQKSHGYHIWGEDLEHQCDGVPWPINRGSVQLPAKIKVRYAASRTGTLIHDVDPLGTHRTVWQGPRHSYGYRTDEFSYYDSDADLIVKLLCRFPSYLQKPILIREADVDQYMTMINVIQGEKAMKMCPHCADVRAGN